MAVLIENELFGLCSMMKQEDEDLGFSSKSVKKNASGLVVNGVVFEAYSVCN